MTQQKNKSFLKSLAVVLLGLLIAFNLTTTVVSLMGYREELEWMPCAFITVDGGSMEPDLYIGDLIFVWRTPYDELEVGDIITSYVDDQYITHKIIRLEEEGIVTKGSANNTEDAPIGQTQYYAKMLFNIKGAGDAFKVISSLPVLIISIILLVVIFYGKTIFAAIFKRRIKKTGALRALSCGALASIMLLPSMFTTARYIAEIGGIGTAVASEVLFTSNFLSTEGNSYRIAGWDGTDYTIALRIQNYCNALRFNHEDIDLSYKIEVEKLTSEGEGASAVTYAQNYTVTVAQSDETRTANSDGYFVITGEDTGGKYDVVNVKITGGSALTAGEVVKFKVTAKTSDNIRYYQELIGYFELEKAASNSFIGSRILEQALGSSLVQYTITSNTVTGTSTRKVVLKWDSRFLYLNTEQTMIWNIIQAGQGKTPAIYDRGDPNGTGEAVYGYLIFNMKTYSSMTFELFKKSDKLNTQIKERFITISGGGTTEDWNEIYLEPVTGS